MDRLSCINYLPLLLLSYSFVSSFDVGQRPIDGLVQRFFNFVVLCRCTTGKVVETLVADIHSRVLSRGLITFAGLLMQDSLPHTAA